MQVCRWWSKSMRLELLSLFSDDDNSVEIRKGNHNRKISNWKHFNGNRKWKRKFQLPINYCLIIQRLWIHAYIYEFVWIPIPSYALSAHQSVPLDFLFFFLRLLSSFCYIWHKLLFQLLIPCRYLRMTIHTHSIRKMFNDLEIKTLSDLDTHSRTYLDLWIEYYY